MWIFIFFNFSVVFIATWLYAGGGVRDIKSLFKRKDGKNKKEVNGKQNGDKA